MLDLKFTYYTIVNTVSKWMHVEKDAEALKVAKVSMDVRNYRNGMFHI